MTYLTGKGMIDDALTIIKNNSSPVRIKMTAWLNLIAQKLAVVRPWTFLSNGSATVTPVDNVLVMPADYGEISSISGGNTFFLDSRHRLTPGEVQRVDVSSTGFSRPLGFTEGTRLTNDIPPVTQQIITLHGAGYTDPVTVSYTIEPPAITDSNTATCWPSKCKPVFFRALLDFFYEYDMDERAALSYQLNQEDLSTLKAWDNSQKPRGQRNRHGYRGGR